MRSFVKIKSSRNREIILSFTDIGVKSSIREFQTSQICLLALFAEIKSSRKFLNLQYKSPTSYLSINKQLTNINNNNRTTTLKQTPQDDAVVRSHSLFTCCSNTASYLCNAIHHFRKNLIYLAYCDKTKIPVCPVAEKIFKLTFYLTINSDCL